MNIYLGKYGVYIDLIVGLDDFWFGKFLQFLGDFESIFFIMVITFFVLHNMIQPFYKLILIMEKLIKIDFPISPICVLKSVC